MTNKFKAILPKPRNRQFGVTLIELLLAIGILGLVAAGAATLVDNHLERTRTAATAQQMTIFANAVQAYIKDNYSDLTVANTHGVPTATATIPAVITTNILQTTPIGLPSGPASPTKYLPSNFSPVNIYGQTICALVLQPKANELYALIVTEGGTAINDLDLGLLAGSVGATGGGIYSKATSTAKGTLGKWQFDLTTDPVGSFFQGKSGSNCSGTVGQKITLAQGHPLMALWFASDTSSAFLYRDKVPGHPELNTMQTDIRFKDDTTMPDPADPKKTIPVYGASLSLQIIRSADTECDLSPTGVGTPVLLGTLARDTTGNVLSCQADKNGKNYWRRAGGNIYWGDPVENWAALTSIPCSATQNSWQTRIVKFPTVGQGPRAFTCAATNGVWSWQGIAVDDKGVLRLGTGWYTEGNNCYIPWEGHGVGSITKDAFGQLLVCTLVPSPTGGLPTLVWKGSAAIGRFKFKITGYSESFIGTGHMSAVGRFSGTLYCDPNEAKYNHPYNPACGSGGTISCSPPPVNLGNATTPESCARYYALHSQAGWGCLFGIPTLCVKDPWHYLDAPLMVDVVNLSVGSVVRQW